MKIDSPWLVNRKQILHYLDQQYIHINKKKPFMIECNKHQANLVALHLIVYVALIRTPYWGEFNPPKFSSKGRTFDLHTPQSSATL
jgi:hypothetical protein